MEKLVNIMVMNIKMIIINKIKNTTTVMVINIVMNKV